MFPGDLSTGCLPVGGASARTFPGFPGPSIGDLSQKQVAQEADIHPSNYSKIEKGEREPSVEMLDKIAALFGVTIDQIVHMDGAVPEEVHFEDKTAAEQLRLLQGLPEEDRKVVYRIIDSMLTKRKFKDFFKQELAS